MKKTYYILKINGEYSWTTELKEEEKEFVVESGESNPIHLPRTCNRIIADLLKKLGKPLELPIDFIGTGEVNNFAFHQLYNDNNFYIYIVDGLYYEIFDRKVRENKVVYPTANNFGDWAWTFQKPSNVVKFVRGHYHVTITEDDLLLK